METVEIPKLTKAQFKALERVFAAEIQGRVLQSRAKIYDEMATDGLVEHGTLILGRDQFGLIKVEGWSLTHAGRLVYCMQCPSDSIAGEPK